MEKVILKCLDCGHGASLGRALIEKELDDDPTIHTIGRLLPRLRCSGCKSRKVQIMDETGAVLVEATDSLRLCIGCLSPIPLPRLNAMPQAMMCLPCVEAGVKPKRAPIHQMPSGDHKTCLRCGSPAIVRHNNKDKSSFIGCTRFPDCWWHGPMTPN